MQMRAIIGTKTVIVRARLQAEQIQARNSFQGPLRHPEPIKATSARIPIVNQTKEKLALAREVLPLETIFPGVL
jgi:hypothetical protein